MSVNETKVRDFFVWKQFLFISAIVFILLFSLGGWYVYIKYQAFKKIHQKLELNSLPQKTNPSIDVSGKNINFGLSSFVLPDANIEIANKLNGAAVLINMEDISIVVMKPIKVDTSVYDKNIIKNDHSTFEKQFVKVITEANLDAVCNDKRFYDFCIYTPPKKFKEYLFSTKNEIELYTCVLMMKLICAKVKTLETNHINALICFDSNNSETLRAFLWSKNGKIAQTIQINSKDTKKNEIVLIKVLSAYQYNLEDLPEEIEVKKILSDAVKIYEKQ